MLLWIQIIDNVCLLKLEAFSGDLHEAIVSTLEM